MKRLKYALVLTIALLSLGDLHSQKSHPHLYFDRAGMEALRVRMQTNPHLNKLWRKFKKFRVDKFAMKIQVPPGPMTTDLSLGRDYGNFMADLTIAYIATGQQKYVDKGKEIALALADKPDWGNQLIVSHIDLGLAFCWDVMYDHFSSSEKEKILSAARTKSRTHVNRNPLSNHNWTPSAGMGVLGLAFRGEGGQRTDRLLEEAKQNFKEGEGSVLWGHGSDGFSPQGPGYWRKYNHVALFLHALRFNEPQNDWFNLGKEYPGSEFLKQSAYPRIYGDVQHPDLALLSWNDAMVIGFHPQGPYGNISALIFAASLYKDAYVMDFTKRLIDAGVRVEEEDHAGFVLFNDEGLAEKSYQDLPLSRYWPDMEAAIFRSGWDKNALVFYMRCGPPAGHPRTIKNLPSDQHNHPDANGFLLFFNNDYLAGEDGHKPQNGPDQHMVITYGHNTILIDGKGQKGDKGRRVGLTRANMDYLDTEHVGYLLGDATTAYQDLHRFYRYAIYKKHKYVVLADDLQDDTSHKYEFLLGTDRHHSLRASGNNTFQARPDNGNAKLEIAFVEPQSIRSEINRERPQVFGSATVDLLRVSPNKKADDANFMVLLYPTKTSDTDPSYTRLYEGDRSGIVVDGDEYFLYNKREGETYRFRSVSTDARLVYFEDNPEAFEYLAAGSREFLFQDQIGFTSSENLVAAFKGRKGKIRLGKSLGTESEATITLRYPGAQGLLIDGIPVPLAGNVPGSLTFALHPKQYKNGPTGYEQIVTDNYEVEIITAEIEPSLTIIQPNGGETWFGRSVQPITWTSQGTLPRVTLEYSADDGSSWSAIVGSAENDGQFEWTVPDTASGGVLIRISDAAGSTLSDTSDGAFSIHKNSALAPVIHAFSPVEGPVGTRVTIVGDHLATVKQVSIGGVLSEDITAASDDTVLAVVASGSSTGPIAVTSEFGTTRTEADFTVVPPDTAKPITLLFTPTDDAFVRSTKPTNNYGDWPELRVRKPSSSRAIAYLKFNVVGTAGRAISAKLQLQVTDGSDDGGAVHVVSNQFKDGLREWSESELLWANAPDITEPALSTSAEATIGQILEFDVTAAIDGNGTYSFALRNESSDALRLAPKELEGAQPPTLLITALPTSTPSPIVTSFEPSENSPSSEVIIFGEHFLNVTNVSFDRIDAIFAVISEAKILAVVPSQATSGPISVVTPAGVASSAAEFTVIADSIPSQTFIFTPTDDASVWEKKPTRNYGSDTALRVRHNRAAKAISYFKFSIAGLVGEISEARLLFHVSDGSDDAGSIYRTSTNFGDSGLPWVEGELNWRNAPSIHGEALSSQGAGQDGDRIQFDVAQAVTRNGIVSFAVVNESNDALMLSSKESAQPPELVITTKGASGTLAGMSATGPSSATISHAADASGNIQLFPSFPNPFNLTTQIPYRLTETAYVHLAIYNLRGREVRTLVEAEQAAGLRVAWWDGKDRSGREVSSGIYLVRLRVGEHTFTNKLVLQK